MTGRRLGRGTLVVGIGAVAALAAGAVWFVTRGSGDDITRPGIDVTSPPPSGMVVDLQRLGPGNAPATTDTVVPLMVAVGGQVPLATVELWAGEAVAERRELDGTDTAVRLTFDWPAVSGSTLLTARAIDVDGREAMSNAIRLEAVGQGPVMAMVDHTLVVGDTMESIAAAYGTPVGAIANANPGVNIGDPATVGTHVAVPVSATLQGVPAPAGEAGPHRRALAAGRGPFPVTVQGCTATVTPPTDPAGLAGLAAYLLPEDGGMFELVASGPAGATLSFPLTPGRGTLVIATFDEAISRLGPPQPVTADGCATGWTGPVRLVGSRLVGAGPADEAYLYLDTGDGWQRVPRSGTVARSRDGFDFAGLLPDTGGEALHVDAWGRAGGALVHLGTGTYQALPSGPPSAVRAQLWWVKSTGPPEALVVHGFVPKPGTLTFRWKASSTWVTGATWQVLGYQPPATAGLDVSGVLAQGSVSATQTTFEIDLEALTGGQTPSSASASLGPLAVAVGAVKAPTHQPPPASTAASAVTLGPTGVPVKASAAFSPVVVAPSTFYVRILPFVGTSFTGRASNTVVIDTKFDPSTLGSLAPEEPGDNVYDLDVTVTPPLAPDPWYARCWTITKFDPSKIAATDPSALAYYQGWQQYVATFGNTVCPICYHSGNTWWDFAGYYGWECADDSGGFDLTDPSTYDEFPVLGPLVTGLVSGVITVYDYLVDLAMALKAKVIDLVALVGCEQFVKIGADAAGTSAPTQAKDWCHKVAEYAVDAVLIYFGVPPTLPNFEQLVENAKGDLAQYIAEQATAFGIPCEEIDTAAAAAGASTLSCKALAQATIDKILDTAQAALSASASAVSGIYFPPGVYAVPHAKGQVQPAVVSITVKPLPGAPSSGVTCPATVTMWASHTAPDHAFGFTKYPDLNTGYQQNFGYANGLWVKAGTYSGAVINPTTVALPGLTGAAGQPKPSGTGFYVMSHTVGHDPVPGATYMSAGTAGQGMTLQRPIPFESLQLHVGATLTTAVHAACAADTLVEGVIIAPGKLAVTKVVG